MYFVFSHPCLDLRVSSEIRLVSALRFLNLVDIAHMCLKQPQLQAALILGCTNVCWNLGKTQIAIYANDNRLCGLSKT